MDDSRYEIPENKLNEILSRAEYWEEVNNRDSGGSTNIGQVLRSELNDVVNSLGFATLWILQDWAKDLKNRRDKSKSELLTQSDV